MDLSRPRVEQPADGEKTHASWVSSSGSSSSTWFQHEGQGLMAAHRSTRLSLSKQSLNGMRRSWSSALICAALMSAGSFPPSATIGEARRAPLVVEGPHVLPPRRPNAALEKAAPARSGPRTSTEHTARSAPRPARVIKEARRVFKCSSSQFLWVRSQTPRIHRTHQPTHHHCNTKKPCRAWASSSSSQPIYRHLPGVTLLVAANP